MEETDSKITVSSINDINSFNMERIITIRGDPEKICKAEAEISVKLRQAFESDLNSLPVSTSFVFLQKVVGLLISQPFFSKTICIYFLFPGSKCHVSKPSPGSHGYTNGYGFGSL